MSFAKTYSAQTSMLKAHTVAVEVDISRGLNSFTLVGLPDKAVEESRDRVCAAIKNSGFESPKSRNEKIVISLAPADIRKEGPMFDVPIALAYLLAAEDLVFDPDKKLFLGELSLDGDVRPIPGVLPLVIHAKESGFTEVYVPTDNAREAALVRDIKIFPVHMLAQLVEHLSPDTKRKKRERIKQQEETPFIHIPPAYAVDLKDIKGQEHAKRALEIAAAGGHNVGLWGPPGTGKTLLAKACASIMPPLAFETALEVTGIHSIAGTLNGDLITHPPFRAPHHTSSYVALIGGGSIPRPGELSLAHRGVLFLDELPEFERRVIEALRQPLEERSVSVSRVRGSAKFPADVILIAALNPCPCGNWGSKKTCTCSAHTLVRYQRKVSGPIIDRIDMWIEVPPVEHVKLSSMDDGEPSAVVAERVSQTRSVQLQRYADTAIKKNSDLGPKDIGRFANMSPEATDTLNAAAAKLDLSGRGYHRVIKLARTIADLERADAIEPTHILEAVQYRSKGLSPQ